MDGITETEQTATSVPIRPRSARLWRIMLVALGFIVVAGIAMLLDPQWLAMHFERRRTMATPGGARRAPDPALLATFPCVPQAGTVRQYRCFRASRRRIGGQ